MFTREIVDEMLHYMKTGEDTNLNDIKKFKKIAQEFCPFTHKENEDNYSCYQNNEGIQLFILYIKKYLICYDFLGINGYWLKDLEKLIERLENPLHNRNYDIFCENVDNLLGFIKSWKKGVAQKIDLLTCEESKRLDESINCFSNNCYLSSTIMAVSSVESRLHFLLKKESPLIYKNTFEKATLGQIIQLFDKDKYKETKYKKVKKILPNKFKSLIETLNNYRIFSAHAKSEPINYQIAHSIMSLSFSFLLDKETKIDKDLTKCN